MENQNTGQEPGGGQEPVPAPPAAEPKNSTQRYAASVKGRDARRRAYKRYMASPKGKAARARAVKKRRANMTPEQRERVSIRARARREKLAFDAQFPGGRMSPEFRDHCREYGIPWPNRPGAPGSSGPVPLTPPDPKNP